MKRVFYISLFVLLGILVQFLVHAVVEIFYTNLLLTNYDVFGLGLPFSAWFTIHTIFSAILFIAGVAIGYWQGVYWWKRMYG